MKTLYNRKSSFAKPKSAGSSIFRLSQDPGGALISNGKRRVVEKSSGKKNRSNVKKKKLSFETGFGFHKCSR